MKSIRFMYAGEGAPGGDEEGPVRTYLRFMFADEVAPGEGDEGGPVRTYRIGENLDAALSELREGESLVIAHLPGEAVDLARCSEVFQRLSAEGRSVIVALPRP